MLSTQSGRGKFASSPSIFTGENLIVAAQERITSANGCLQRGESVENYFLSGLAVECTFRAFRFRINPEFDARHDLYELARVSGFLDQVPVSQQERFGEALANVALRWSSNHRFRNENELRGFLNRAGLYRVKGQHTIKGDVLQFNGRIILESATYIINLGVARWAMAKTT